LKFFLFSFYRYSTIPSLKCRKFYKKGKKMKNKRKLLVGMVLITFILVGFAFHLSLHVNGEASNVVTIRLVDSNGNGIQGGSASYYSGGWQTIPGTTDVNGEITVEMETLKIYTFRMNYEGSSIDQSQDVSTDPIVVFQTQEVTVELRDSNNNLMDQGEVKYYASGWQDAGTTSGGQVTLQLLPKQYSFRMYYVGASLDKNQDISADPAVIFQMVLITVELRDNANNLILTDSGEAKYYASGWKVFGTTTSGQVQKELLPRSYSFRMIFEGNSKDQSQDVNADPVVIFQMDSGSDTESPEIIVTSPTDGQFLNTTEGLITGTVTDTSSIAYVRVNGKNAQVDGQTFSYTLPLSEGENTITVEAEDSYQNKGSVSIRVTLDNLLPQITVTH
jgi:hypothetical protein